MATFSYFGYLCGYLPMCGLDTQESILATKVSNLRNKSHLFSKMTTCVSNCPNFIATGVPIGLYGKIEGRTEGRKAENYVPPLFFEKAGDNNTQASLRPNMLYLSAQRYAYQSFLSNFLV